MVSSRNTSGSQRTSRTTPTRRSVSSSAKASAKRQSPLDGVGEKLSSFSSTLPWKQTSTNRSRSYSALQQPSRVAAATTAGAATRTASYRATTGTRKQSNVLTIIIGVVIILAIVILLDFFLHLGKIYGNVYVGDVNISGMTRTEAVTAIEAQYTPMVTSGSVTAYSSPDAKSQKLADNLLYMIQVNDTYLENHPEIVTRVISGSDLEGTVNSTELAEEAYRYGRGLSGLLGRISLIFSPHVITPTASYGQVALQGIADYFDEQCGTPMTSSNVQIVDGSAVVIEGNDGYTVGTEQLTTALNKAFFSTNLEDRQFALYSSYTPMAVTVEAAQAAADQLNNAMGDGAVFYYENNAWSVSPLTLSSWITVGTEAAADGTTSFTYSLNESAIHSWLLKWILADSADSIKETMETDSRGNVTVYPDVSGKIPQLSEAVTSLHTAMFGDGSTAAESGADAIDGVAVSVHVGAMNVPSSLSIEDAIASGVVSPIASFSTSYINGSTTDNRTFNVRMAATTVSGTVVKAGEEFSFNAIVGATDEAAGYKVGTVIDWKGDYVDGYGGGVCQVSTTLFNAVFEAGFPVTERLNHSLYSANYPDGRDATVDYPSTDFKWVNDSSSDVYILFTDDGTNITCTLYGADPHYVVYDYTFPMEELGNFTTYYYIDESQSSDYHYVKSVGVSPRRYRVWRTVYEPDGATLRIDETYVSTYQAIDEYDIIGPGEFAEEVKAAGLVVGYI